MWNLIRSPKWITLTLLVLILVPTFKSLSDWQWRRYHARIEFNNQVVTATNMPPISFEQIAPNGNLLDNKNQWRTVTVTGSFIPNDQYLVRKKSLNSDPGMWVVNSFRSSTGQVITVVRGWTAAGNSAKENPTLSSLSSDTLTLTGRVREISPKNLAEPNDLPIGQRIGIDPKNGSAYLELINTTPALNNPEVIPLPMPTLSEGSHRGYAIQWLIFIVMLIGGYVILLRNELIQRRELPVV